jgi:hypothetical protein
MRPRLDVDKVPVNGVTLKFTSRSSTMVDATRLTQTASATTSLLVEVPALFPSFTIS